MAHAVGRGALRPRPHHLLMLGHVRITLRRVGERQLLGGQGGEVRRYGVGLEHTGEPHGVVGHPGRHLVGVEVPLGPGVDVAGPRAGVADRGADLGGAGGHVRL